jgi:phage terminase small subunit
MTFNQRRFADLYIETGKVGSSYNQAFRHISKGPHDCKGSQLLRVPHVALYIEHRRHELAKAAHVTQERVVHELAKMAFANLDDYLQRDEAGQITGIDISECSRDQLAALTEARIIEDTWREKDGTERTKTQRIVKIADKRASLESLAKILGFQAPTKGELAVNVTVGLAERLTEARKRVAASVVDAELGDGGEQ